ncbi:MAG: FAD binding domain-containing protein [Natronincolaceae bacterium]|jgi:CO/xanthine dehydrogenase FAD-binding subunit|nr:FAD binding domain-containing protein [Bacillota bacterium]
MIGFDFEYYKPDTIDEAVKLFNDLDSLGKVTIYYGGGSEFISMARVSTAYADAVIDIKGIEECNQYKMDGDNLVIGAGVTLTDIAEGNLFPALSKAVKRIADHTMQGKITIGGNICGTIIYRETVLPLLVSDSRITLASKDGQREELLRDVFDERLKLNKGEMVVRITVPGEFLNLPYLHVKRTKNEVIDYPLISMVALKNKDKIHMAFSGLGNYPFRSFELEEALNSDISPKENKIQQAIGSIDDKINDSLTGSKEYKKFMLHHVLDTALKDFQEAN